MTILSRSFSLFRFRFLRLIVCLERISCYRKRLCDFVFFEFYLLVRFRNLYMIFFCFLSKQVLFGNFCLLLNFTDLFTRFFVFIRILRNWFLYFLLICCLMGLSYICWVRYGGIGRIFIGLLLDGFLFFEFGLMFDSLLLDDFLSFFLDLFLLT